MSLNEDILNIIFKNTNNYYCAIVCKQWYNIILKNSKICDKCTEKHGCHKIIQMYDNELWFTDPLDTVCHGYYSPDLDYYKILKSILRSSPKFIQKINRQSIGLCLAMVKYFSESTKLVKNMTKRFQYEALKVNQYCFKYFVDPSYRLCQQAVKHHGVSLEYIPKKHKTDKLCRMALKNSATELQYIENQTEEMCLQAIGDRYSCSTQIFSYIHNQTEKICVEAFKKNSDIVNHIKYI